MKILCKTTNSINVPPTLQVNKVGKYLKQHLDGAFKLNISSNMCDVYVTILYEIPPSPEIHDLNEMILDLNITTYQNKLRVNIIEVSPKERTLGYSLFDTKKITKLEDMKDAIFQKVIKQISKAYEDYDFVF